MTSTGIRDDVLAAGFTIDTLAPHAANAHAERLQQPCVQVRANAPIRLASLTTLFWPAFAVCAGDAL